MASSDLRPSKSLFYGVLFFLSVRAWPKHSRLRAAILISVYRERMRDRSRLLYCDPMRDRNSMIPKPSEGLALMSFWRMLDAENNCDRSWETLQMLGSDSGRTDFSRIFIFGPPVFFADFVAGFFLLIFVGKSAQKNPPGKIPAKSSKIYTTKIPDTFLQRGRANK